MKAEGSLSVFFSMLFPLMILFLLSLLSFGRARMLRAALLRDQELAAKNVLAEYSGELVRKYGLYMIPSSRLEESFGFYLAKNSYHPFGAYEIQNLSVLPEKTLAEPEVLEKEIVRFMEDRWVLDSVPEILSLFSELEEKEEVKKDYARYRHSAELYLIQTLYSRLITDVYGVRDDGGRNEAAVLRFLKNELKLPTVLAAAENSLAILMATGATGGTGETGEAGEMEALYEELVILEQAKGEISTVRDLTREAEELCGQISEELRSLIELEEEEREEGQLTEETSLLTDLKITPEMLERAGKVLSKNAAFLENAEAVIDSLLAESVPEDFSDLYDLQRYDYQITLPHEASPARSLDLSGLFQELRGYSVDVETLAPDRQLEFPENILAESENGDFSPLSLSLSLNLETLKEHFLTAEYGLGMFCNFRQVILQQEGEVPRNLRHDPMTGRFLSNETEFLLVGQDNEFKNVEGTRKRMVALRTLLNMAYLLADPEKRQQIEELAAMTGGILLPGIGNAVAYGLILTGWSVAESVEDYRALTRGIRVPLMKDRESFRTDLSTLLAGESPEEQYQNNEGMSYRQYLRILLLMENQEKLIRRIQTLLRLNEPSVLMEESVTAFRVSGTVLPENGMPPSMDFSGEYGYE